MKRTDMKRMIVAAALLGCAAAPAAGQGLTSGPYELPYKNTYVKEVFVAENEYRTARPERIEPLPFEQARKILPAPVWEGHDREIEMYWHAWRIAVGNIRQPQEGSGFVSPYLDIAYNGDIFMWDMSFMMMYARYGYRYFPFQRSLDNFYAKQHPDGFICREIRADGSDCFERYDPTSTGPDLLPWVELAYYRQFGDIERLHRVFPALCAYAKWWRLNRTWPDGTYWSSGWGTGMDNMPRVKPEYNPIFSHGHMVWLDTNLQQMLVDESLLQIGFYIERWQEIEWLEDEMKHLKRYVNEHLWDEQTGFLHDRYGDGSLCPTKGIGAYWALQTDALDGERLDRLVAHLSTRRSSPGRTGCRRSRPTMRSTTLRGATGRAAYGPARTTCSSTDSGARATGSWPARSRRTTTPRSSRCGSRPAPSGSTMHPSGSSRDSWPARTLSAGPDCRPSPSSSSMCWASSPTTPSSVSSGTSPIPRRTVSSAIRSVPTVWSI